MHAYANYSKWFNNVTPIKYFRKKKEKYLKCKIISYGIGGERYKMFKDKHGQGGLVAAFISILVAVIVGVGVAIPVIQDTITNAALTGTTLTIVNLIPLMIGLVLFVAVATLITVRG